MSDQVIVTKRIKRALYAVLDVVDTYPWHVCATIPAKKLDAVISKFLARYPDLSRDRKRAWRLRQAGQPSHKLIVFRPENRDINGFFVLLSSAMDESGERWLDARQRGQRIVVYDYELVRHTRPGKSSPAWTWRIEAQHYRRLHEQMIDAIDKKKDRWLNEWLRSTTHWPGFAGIREQHAALKRAFYGRWQRTRRASELPPEFPRLPYVTRRATSALLTAPKAPGGGSRAAGAGGGLALPRGVDLTTVGA